MRKRNIFFILPVILFFFLLAGCQSGKPVQPKTSEAQSAKETTDFKGVSIDGAGASFPAPIYNKWAFAYEDQMELKINYQSVGSGAGIAQIKGRTVDFGASDAPLELAELDASGLTQFPMIIGGVVPVINVEGISQGQLKLSGEVLANIFLGEITKWNDPAIAGLNQGLALPNIPIVVVHRADGSGTTWIFTSYLDKVSPKWHEKVGAAKSVAWPVGNGGQGNEGVSNYIQQVQGSIGYVEYAYAVQNNIVTTQLMNQAGNFVAPSIETFQAAAANADWANAPGFYMVLVDQPGEQSWPITGASFIIIYKEQADQNKAKAMLSFFDWCFKNGGPSAKEMDYVPLPDSLVQMIEKSWGEQIVAGGQRVWK